MGLGQLKTVCPIIAHLDISLKRRNIVVCCMFRYTRLVGIPAPCRGRQLIGSLPAALADSNAHFRRRCRRRWGCRVRASARCSTGSWFLTPRCQGARADRLILLPPATRAGSSSKQQSCGTGQSVRLNSSGVLTSPVHER